MWEGDFGLFWGVGAMTGRCPTVAVVGAGMSGMCVAITLLSAGITDVCIYEKADDVGGTWRDNTYPGLTCDVPSRLYQYSFAKNPNWTQMFSRGGEIQDYLRGIAERYGLRHRIRFGATVVSARFDDGRWVLRTDSGTESTVDFLISATGVLHHPRIPPIAGLDDFRGTVFHSARWDHTVPLLGRRIAVIGTGSTAYNSSAAWLGSRVKSPCSSAPHNGCCRGLTLDTRSWRVFSTALFRVWVRWPIRHIAFPSKRSRLRSAIQVCTESW